MQDLKDDVFVDPMPCSAAQLLEIETRLERGGLKPEVIMEILINVNVVLSV